MTSAINPNSVSGGNSFDMRASLAAWLQRLDFQADEEKASASAFEASVFLPAIPPDYLSADMRNEKRRDYIRWRDGTEHELVNG